MYASLSGFTSPLGPVFRHPDAPLPSFRTLSWISSACTGAGFGSPFIDPPQDFPKQVARHGNLGQLERDVPPVTDSLRSDLDQPSLSLERPVQPRADANEHHDDKHCQERSSEPPPVCRGCPRPGSHGPFRRRCRLGPSDVFRAVENSRRGFDPEQCLCPWSCLP